MWLRRAQVAFPMSPESDLLGKLMHDFSIEGWMLKAGPRERDAWKKRWFTLDRRTLMYFADPLVRLAPIFYS